MLRLQIEKILKSSGLSVTKNRKKLLKAFLHAAKPLALDQIRLLIGYIDRVTLFRILSAFEERKIIHTIMLEDGSKLFALCDKSCDSVSHNHDHIHFKCDSCDDVSCLSVDKFPDFKIPNYMIRDISINVNGLCANCS